MMQLLFVMLKMLEVELSDILVQQPYETQLMKQLLGTKKLPMTIVEVNGS